MLLSNGKQNHLEIIQSMFTEASNIYVIVAFMRSSGLSKLLSDFEANLINKGTLNIIIGLDLYVTEPSALYDLYKLDYKYKNMSFYLYHSDKSTFHPKIYAANRNEVYSVLVGSANLTNGGLQTNTEMSIFVEDEFEDFQQVEQFYQKLLRNKECSKASHLEIRHYEIEYDIFRKQQEKAQLKSKVLFVEKTSKSILLKYYEEYCNNKNEMDDLEQKKLNYIEAKKVLGNLTSKNITSTDSFLEIYEKLVGAAGKGQLWHSGSILRSKTRVAKNYNEFILLVDFLTNYHNRNKAVVDVFESIIPYKKSIYGLGFNVITEMLNTFSPDKFPVLNKNPISSVKFIFGKEFKEPDLFKSKDYKKYTDFMHSIRNEIGAINFIETDHFLNYVYWTYAKK
ncbi:restriction endonuclease PLD domain-containing protein [Photobacterium piscicola]|uniref:restriction endonuclease PLD domain-containing protein n=1 Tax=Photobacterium piscicola TaxID=1378299 RepID=UPI002E190E37|nr:restriction endonuclease PLD domain-containing protein [Photobacterium piscicola]